MAKRVVVDLFAGSGGMGLGLELAGFQPVFVSELHPDALSTYLINRPDSPVQEAANHAGDILEYTQQPDMMRALALRLNAEHGEIDLVVGGPPCQGYSGIGHRRTFTELSKVDIPSNHLYREMATFVSAVGPKAFVFENVRGLLSSRWTPGGDRVWEDVLRTFKNVATYITGTKEEYFVDWAIVRAADYGVPQNRPRVLLVGVRADLGFEPRDGGLASGLVPQGSEHAPDLIDVLGDLIDPVWSPGGQTGEYPRAVGDAQLARWFRTRRDGTLMRKGSALSEHQYSNHSERVLNRFAEMHRLDGEIPPELRTKKFAQRLLRERWDGGIPNITVASLPDDYVHFKQFRTLTVREWARLQTFPDWYEFAGKRTTGGRRRAGDPSCGVWERELPKYTQIGNAVPVFLARALGHHLSGLLDELEGGQRSRFGSMREALPLNEPASA